MKLTRLFLAKMALSLILVLLIGLFGGYFLFRHFEEDEIEDVVAEEISEITGVTSPGKKNVYSKVYAPVRYVDVSSKQYSLKIPVFKGFDLETRRSDSEFILGKYDPDLEANSLSFYFESDYSPNLANAKKLNFEISSGNGLKFNVMRSVLADGKVVDYIEDQNDTSFYFSGVYDKRDLEYADDILAALVKYLEVSKITVPAAESVSQQVNTSSTPEVSGELSFIDSVQSLNKPAYELVTTPSFRSAYLNFFGSESEAQFKFVSYFGVSSSTSSAYVVVPKDGGGQSTYVVSEGCMKNACSSHGVLIYATTNVFDNYGLVGERDNITVYGFGREVPSNLRDLMNFVYRNGVEALLRI